jgi:hypothetical protein
MFSHVDDKVFLRISPMKGVMQFGKKEKLSHRLVGLLEIVMKLSKLASQVTSPSDLAGMHDIFHLSMLRKYIADSDHVIEYEPLQIQEDMTYEEVLVHILDCKEHVLCAKRILIVKVLWRNHGVEDESWEVEQDMQTRYTHFFEGAYDLRS